VADAAAGAAAGAVAVGCQAKTVWSGGRVGSEGTRWKPIGCTTWQGQPCPPEAVELRGEGSGQGERGERGSETVQRRRRQPQRGGGSRGVRGGWGGRGGGGGGGGLWGGDGGG
jgi:hypothetical protein